MEKSIQYDLSEIELAFLDALNNPERIGGFVIRLRHVLKQVTDLKLKAKEDDAGPLSRQIQSVSYSLNLIAQAFKSLRKLKREKAWDHAQDITFAKRFFLDNLHFPFPSPSKLRKIASESCSKPSVISNWFKKMRVRLGYGRLARDYCAGDKKLLKDYLRRVLRPSTSFEDPSVPVQVRHAIFRLRRRAYEILGAPAETSSNILTGADQIERVVSTDLPHFEHELRCLATQLNGSEEVDSASGSSFPFTSTRSEFDDPFDPGSFQGCDIDWNQNLGFEVGTASSSIYSTVFESPDLLIPLDSKDINGSRVTHPGKEDDTNAGTLDPFIGLPGVYPTFSMVPEEVLSPLNNQPNSGDGQNFFASPMYDGFHCSLSSLRSSRQTIAGESLLGLHEDNSTHFSTCANPQSDIIHHLQSLLMQKDALIHQLLQPVSF